MGTLMNVAVVDDSREDAEVLIGYLNKFEAEHNISITKTIFYASFDFLEKYQGEYDVIFLDIEMPGSNGLEVAREIRSKDEAVGIIFVTSMAQYAINGYEVNAIDFMVKPMGYYNFSVKLEKAFRFFRKRNVHEILISSREGIRKVSADHVYYIEKERDNLVFHTKDGSFKERGSIKAMKEELKEFSFVECTAGCLVNLRYVKLVDKDMVCLETEEKIPLSRRLKRQFSMEYINYMGGGF